MLTDAQELQINSATYTHNYEAEASAGRDTDGDDLSVELTLRFETSIEGKYDGGDDLGGLTVYFKEGELVAFYDYENFKGTVFDI